MYTEVILCRLMWQGVLNELLSVSDLDLDAVRATQQALSADDWLLRKQTLVQV